MKKTSASLGLPALLLPVVLGSLALCSPAGAQQSPAEPQTPNAQRASDAPTAPEAQLNSLDALPDSPGALVSSSAPDSLAPATDLQSSPTPQTSPASTSNTKNTAPKRLFYILPNFRTVSVGTVLPPLTVKDKFVLATQDSFDYSALLLAIAVAGEADVANDDPEFGSGGIGFGRYLWHAAVDQTSENYWVEFIIPAITHEDTRYYNLGTGGFRKRAEYSLGQVLVTRTDSGKRTFNAGEVFGAGISAGLSNLYYPTPERTVGNTLFKYATNVIIDGLSYFVKEFYPEISGSVRHSKQQTAAP